MRQIISICFFIFLSSIAHAYDPPDGRTFSVDGGMDVVNYCNLQFSNLVDRDTFRVKFQCVTKDSDKGSFGIDPMYTALVYCSTTNPRVKYNNDIVELEPSIFSQKNDMNVAHEDYRTFNLFSAVCLDKWVRTQYLEGYEPMNKKELYGKWVPADQKKVCKPSKILDNDDQILISSSVIATWESECKIRQSVKNGSGYLITSQCSGEGEVSKSTRRFSLIYNNSLLVTERGRPSVLYKKCDGKSK